MTVPTDSAANDLHIDQISIHALTDTWPLRQVVHHARVTIPASALAALVSAAGTTAGIPVHGSLQRDRLRIQVAVSIVKLAVAFRASVDDGILVLTPADGVPGWLIGRAAPILRDMPGVEVSGSGTVTVDIRPMLPPGVLVPGGVRSLAISPDRIELVIGAPD